MKVNSKLMGFAAGTKILMADGSQKEIEKINTGDLVLSFDQLDAFGTLEPKRVLNTFMRVDRNPLKVKVKNSNVELTVAPDQLFIDAGNDWKEATKINEIIDSEGNICPFEVTQINRGKHQMYDIIVEDNHSLIANGVRVHNLIYRLNTSLAERVTKATTEGGTVSNYNKKDDLENTEFYSQGVQRKKKVGIRKNTNVEPKIDGSIAASKLLSSIEDLTDVVAEVIEETTTNNLTPIKGSIQNSIDNLISYMNTFTSSVVNGSLSTYDKSTLLDIADDFVFAASAVRKPFDETVVTTAGKLVAMNQITAMELYIVKMFDVLETYTGAAAEDRGYFNVEKDGQQTLSSNKRNFAASRASNGQYQTGGSRSNYGGNSSRSQGSSTTGGGPSPTRNTNPSRTPAQKTRPAGTRSVAITSEDRYRTDRATSPKLSSGGQFENTVDRLNTSNSTKQYVGQNFSPKPFGSGSMLNGAFPKANSDGIPKMDAAAAARRDRRDVALGGPGQGSGGLKSTGGGFSSGNRGPTGPQGQARSNPGKTGSSAGTGARGPTGPQGQARSNPGKTSTGAGKQASSGAANPGNQGRAGR
jgi:hypothetical protein